MYNVYIILIIIIQYTVKCIDSRCNIQYTYYTLYNVESVYVVFYRVFKGLYSKDEIVLL